MMSFPRKHYLSYLTKYLYPGSMNAGCQQRQKCSKPSINKKDLSHPIEKTCSVQDIENGWYEWWESKNFFRRKNADKRFVMLLPPPNVTGNLHIGHALTCSIQDALARWNQMKGYEVLWIPGCDHAGIATQVVVEKHLLETLKLTRNELGREKFLDEVMKWKDEKGATIYNQLRRMGISIDWQEAFFTLDPKICSAINEAIERLFDEDLIYRANMMINWDCSLQSVISDAEVEYLSVDSPTDLMVPNHDSPVSFGHMYDIGYRLQDSDESVIVSTTRPETIFGDTAVMVHPDDERYSHLHAKFVHHPFRNDLIPVIKDSHVDRALGTGIVKVTPGHSLEDYEVGLRHNLAVINIIDDYGRMTETPSEVQGMPRFKARDWVLNQLAAKCLYKGNKPHSMQLPICSRSGDVVEHRLKVQWFMKMEELTRAARKAVEEGILSIQPDQYRRVWNQFLSGNRDWCISRQLWWGHRIPIYWTSTKRDSVYGNDNEVKMGSSVFVAASSEEKATLKGAQKLGVTMAEINCVVQETDVLDTWFSSGLLPFAVFGWPDNTEELQKYYPLSLMETGHDIIFFWVARMVMLGLQLTKHLPFEKVLLHPLVCDSQKHKMSKSRGNALDPRDIMDGIEQATNSMKEKSSSKIPVCGSDALRFSLCSYDIHNWLISLDMTTVEKNCFFRNKMWQTVRFVLENVSKITGGLQHMKTVDKERVDNVLDAWIISRLSEMVSKANEGFNNYELHKVTRSLKTFWYTHLCDVYLEAIKPRLWNSDDMDSAYKALSVLYTCCHNALLVLSPFMPFLSEELYHRLPSSETKYLSIMECSAPSSEQWNEFRNPELEEHVSTLLEAASCLRYLRKTFDIKSSLSVSGNIYIEDQEVMRIAVALTDELARLSFLSNISVLPFDHVVTEHCLATHCVCPGITVQLDLHDVLDIEKEKERLRSKLDTLERQKQNLEKKLNRGLPNVIEKNRKRLEETEENIRHYEQHMRKVMEYLK